MQEAKLSMRSTAPPLSPSRKREDLAFVIKLVGEGKLEPVIDRRCPLAKAAEAVRCQSEVPAMGKTVIEAA